MNDIINWIALNNTLLIRIGFSAVLILLIVYVFRFFFMPSISVVSTEGVSGSDDKKKSGIDVSIEELAELQAEIDTLKVKLKEAESKPAPVEPATPTATATVTAVGASAEVVKPTVTAEAASPSVTAELTEKLKTLESRLAEYEIIAEEIAEIGKLRQENQELKSKISNIGSNQAPVESSEVSAESIVNEKPEVASEEQMEVNENDDKVEEASLGSADESEVKDPASESTGEANLLEDAEKILESAALAHEEKSIVSGGAEAVAIEQMLIQSEIEVTDEEKDNINSFESFKSVLKG